MSNVDDEYPTLEARRRAEVERAVSPYKGKVPDFMLAKLYELAERYWTEHPVASRALQLQQDKQRSWSGDRSQGEPAARSKKPRVRRG